ncbi:MAG: putative membrane protein YeiH [Sphingobacteriales bacterium]|jgi:uncharacterized membrane protein YeiH
MIFSDLIYFIDLFGTLVFAISGVTVAIKKDFDLVGSIVLGFVTAVGGGTLRDLLIGQTPVGWLQDRNYLIIIACSIPLVYLGQKYILKLHRSLFLFDTIGIGLFTVLGIEKTLGLGLSPEIALMMGVITACFGGVLRDVLANEVPLIFRREIYASACVIGGIGYLISNYWDKTSQLGFIASILLVIAIRYLSVRKGWSLNLKPLN